jgi:hypothetical protein
MKGYGANGGKLVLRTVHDQPREWAMTERKPHRYPKGTPRTAADPINVRKSAARARAEIEDWVRMMCTPDVDYRLVTLTKRGGMLSYQECWDAVASMRRQVEKHYPGVAFLAVPERHLGDGANHGTYHVHCIMVFPAGVQPIYSVFHRLWKRALGGTGSETGVDAPGNVDFARTHAKDGTRYTACQAARYLAKYVTKDVFGGNVGGKRYTTTHGAPTAPKRYWWEPIDANHSRTRSRMIQCLREFYPATDYQILHQTFHDGGDTYHVFSAEPCPKLTT